MVIVQPAAQNWHEPCCYRFLDFMNDCVEMNSDAPLTPCGPSSPGWPVPGSPARPLAPFCPFERNTKNLKSAELHLEKFKTSLLSEETSDKSFPYLCSIVSLSVYTFKLWNCIASIIMSCPKISKSLVSGLLFFTKCRRYHSQKSQKSTVRLSRRMTE